MSTNGTRDVSISAFSRDQLERQGILGFSDAELATHRPGLPFAYQMCFTVTLIGIVLQSIPVLAVAMVAALGAVVLPKHPFDYLYDVTLGPPRNKPKLPRRSAQGRFACAIATLWLGATIYLFASGSNVAGIVLGCLLLIPASLVGFFDICIPSAFYNLIRFGRLHPGTRYAASANDGGISKDS
ncbi:MAG: DUF4395 family protein [Betaproteobacteria bacterium]|nr:MAG: DUF4395 family protein [Betaproteobacteria bacterium]